MSSNSTYTSKNYKPTFNRGDNTCHQCGETGHWAKNCRYSQLQQQQRRPFKPRHKELSEYEKDLHKHLPYLLNNLGSHQFTNSTKASHICKGFFNFDVELYSDLFIQIEELAYNNYEYWHTSDKDNLLLDISELEMSLGPEPELNEFTSLDGINLIAQLICINSRY